MPPYVFNKSAVFRSEKNPIVPQLFCSVTLTEKHQNFRGRTRGRFGLICSLLYVSTPAQLGLSWTAVSTFSPNVIAKKQLHRWCTPISKLRPVLSIRNSARNSDYWPAEIHTDETCYPRVGCIHRGRSWTGEGNTAGIGSTSQFRAVRWLRNQEAWRN